jgi:hypothetical protein
MGGLHMNVRSSLMLLIVGVVLLPAWRAVGQEREPERVLFLGDEKWVNEAREHWDRAKRLAQEKKYGEAMEEVLWCLKNSPDPYPEIEQGVPRQGVRFLWELGKASPDVEKAYKKRRAAHEKAFRAGKGTMAKAVELDAMYQAQGDWTKMQEFYNELAEKGKEGKKARALLHMFVEGPLLEDGEYEALLMGAGDGPSSLESRMQKLEEAIGKLQNVDEKIKDSAKLHLCKSAGRYYQAMLWLKKDKEAAERAEEFVQYHPKGATYAIFIRNAAQAEKLDAARKLVKEAKQQLKGEDLADVKAEEKHLPKVKKSSKGDKDDDQDKGKKDRGKKKAKSD